MLLNVFRIRAVEKEIRSEVRDALLANLYASRLSLVIGATVAVSIGGLIAYRAQSIALIICTLLIAIAGTARVLSFSMFGVEMGLNASQRERWALVYDLGAWVYAALIGLLTYLTFQYSDDLRLQLLAGSLSTGFAAGAAGRNSGRPVTGVGQLLLCGLPLSIALLLEPFEVANWLLALSNVLYIAVIIDITLQTYKTVLSAFTERQEKLDLAAVYKQLSRTDPLTGIYNRNSLKSRLESLIESGTRCIALIWIDLDRFKQINDTLGHAAGDLVLGAVAVRLSALRGEDGVLARFGGDEFIIVQPVATPDDALGLAERVRIALNAPVDVEGTTLDLSASVGVTVSETRDAIADDLLRHADLALYEAKSKGRNCVVPFHPEMEERLIATKTMEHELKRALERGELSLNFQPIVDLATGVVRNCEALLRWKHPVLGNVPPSLFVPIAEASGQISAITAWVIDRACAAAMTWPEEVAVSVNISPILLKGRDLPPMIHGALLRHGLATRRLVLEITETVLVEDNPNIAIILRNFQQAGIHLSLDDFGTGYSSLAYLCRYSFNSLKIDKSFTATIDRSSEARAIIQAVASIAGSLGLTVVAEGVETQEQLDFVRNEGCGSAQGYFFARPLPEAQVRNYLMAQSSTPPAVAPADARTRQRRAISGN